MLNVSYTDIEMVGGSYGSASAQAQWLLLVPVCPVVFISSAQMASGETEARQASPRAEFAELG